MPTVRDPLWPRERASHAAMHDITPWSADELARFHEQMLAQPFHAWIGLELVRVDDDGAVCRIRVDDHTDGGGGYLHGGITEAALDAACWFAAMPRVPRDHWLRTCQASYALMRPAWRGEEVELRASVDRSGRTLVFLRAEAWAMPEDGPPRQLVTASLVKAVVPVGG